MRLGECVMAQPFIQPGTAFEGYVIDSLLHRGANAVVYLARSADQRSWHAIKRLHRVDSRKKIRLEQEAIFREELQHPNIVPAQSMIEIHGEPALVMDFVDGPNLSTWLRELDPPLRARLEVFRGIVEGVHHAHQSQVIHRDLKPSNVLMQQVGTSYQPRISDFGLGKALAPEMGKFGGLTTVNTGLGTSGYAAPEQMKDAAGVGPEADLYALGAILYELVCGVGPFAGLSTFDVVAAQNEERYTDPEQIAPDLPPDLYVLIADLLRPEPSHRPQDCPQVLLRVDRLLEPLSEPPAEGISDTVMRFSVATEDLRLGHICMLTSIPLMALALGALAVL